MNATTDTLVTLQGRGNLGHRLLKATGRALVTALVKYDQWRELSRQNRALLALDDRLLKDIGINRLEAERQAQRPFWQRSVVNNGWRPGRD